MDGVGFGLPQVPQLQAGASLTSEPTLPFPPVPSARGTRATAIEAPSRSKDEVELALQSETRRRLGLVFLHSTGNPCHFATVSSLPVRFLANHQISATSVPGDRNDREFWPAFALGECKLQPQESTKYLPTQYSTSPESETTSASALLQG